MTEDIIKDIQRHSFYLKHRKCTSIGKVFTKARQSTSEHADQWKEKVCLWSGQSLLIGPGVTPRSRRRSRTRPSCEQRIAPGTVPLIIRETTVGADRFPARRRSHAELVAAERRRRRDDTTLGIEAIAEFQTLTGT